MDELLKKYSYGVISYNIYGCNNNNFIHELYDNLVSPKAEFL